jgi:hypothetical protein
VNADVNVTHVSAKQLEKFVVIKVGGKKAPSDCDRQ